MRALSGVLVVCIASAAVNAQEARLSAGAALRQSLLELATKAEAKVQAELVVSTCLLHESDSADEQINCRLRDLTVQALLSRSVLVQGARPTEDSRIRNKRQRLSLAKLLSARTLPLLGVNDKTHFLVVNVVAKRKSILESAEDRFEMESRVLDLKSKNKTVYMSNLRIIKRRDAGALDELELLPKANVMILLDPADHYSNATIVHQNWGRVRRMVIGAFPSRMAAGLIIWRPGPGLSKVEKK